MDQENRNGSSDRDVLYLTGGLALMVLGAGLIVSRPAVRQVVSGAVSSVLPDMQGKLGIDISGVGTDLQRYMRLRSM